ncbi:uncharacterized protein VDAG_06516 [Verticillium dahliae VdLs.17]|uniref:Uncharacterized protein n=1 Tax=Verticillium dahliae (strain VdLs.17 / ATCC MYA-4575 / FGSC 10137) TaxID=498257 RepID=G2X7Q8_VERDV|nr:uncharacterized protein VDAG_06516 [Verticillium dahliae VdLs.17]EGY15026.1 hypothetical protein VDAG_06516 [Verticillium dahliae VdLs.17]KAH6694512.1 hypothetical protein EV126DRAFT_76911 [Verticillium dahliae]
MRCSWQRAWISAGLYHLHLIPSYDVPRIRFLEHTWALLHFFGTSPLQQACGEKNTSALPRNACHCTGTIVVGHSSFNFFLILPGASPGKQRDAAFRMACLGGQHISCGCTGFIDGQA